MKRINMSTAILVVNGLLVFTLLVIFLQLTGKFLLQTGSFSKAAFLFKITGATEGQVIALIENDEREKAEAIINNKNDALLNGILSWTQQNYPEASAYFDTAGHDRFLAYTQYKEGNFDKIRDKAKDGAIPVLEPHFKLRDKDYDSAADGFLDTHDFAGLSSLFLSLGNEPTAIYYLYRQGHPHTHHLADLLAGKDAPNMPQASGKEIKIWYNVIQGKLPAALEGITNPAKSPLGQSLQVLSESPKNLNTEHLSSAITNFQAVYPSKDTSRILDDLIKSHETLKVFSVLPSTVDDREYNRSYMTIFGVALLILISAFSVALYFLYLKYKASLVTERQKDLEKMDALSLAKMQNMEAKRKRDKTELNVSSFVTLNIQLEVMDAAFTKLGLRVDPRKLAEQIEKTKIPNISYKVYTISNSYGFDVKMESMEFKELQKLKKHGAVILVLKGDLIALLKRADGQNAYLQFSKKDSRKVPEAALKLSWDGNLITLNKV